MNIIEQALKILENYKWHTDLPASLSGRHHCNETVMEHLVKTVNVTKHLCDEFGLYSSDKDMLVACAYLHDIGNVLITVPGKVDLPGWLYYEKVNVSRNQEGWKHHGILSAQVIEQYSIKRRVEIKKIVSAHMSKWFPNDPQPQNLFEYIICAADYVASRGNKIFEYKGE